MSINAKLTILTLGMLIVLTSSIAYALVSLKHTGTELQQIAHDVEITNAVSKITVHQLEQAINFERALRHGLNIGVADNAKELFNESITAFHQYNKKVEAELSIGEQLARQGIATASLPKGIKEYTHVSELLTKVELEHLEYVEHVEHVFVLLGQGNTAAALAATQQIELEEENIDHELEQLLQELERFTQEATLESVAHETTAFNVLISFGLAAIVAILLNSFMIIKSISNGLLKATRAAEELAGGNLRCEVQVLNNGTLGRLEQALKNMRNNLRVMVTEMGASSGSLNDSAASLTAITVETNRSVQEQKIQVLQVAAAVKKMSTTVEEVAINAESTAQSAKLANSEATEGQVVVQSTISSIQALANGVENSATAINQVGLDSDSIGRIVGVIKSIAEQTNLLALNAAIEAARAGEKGRGFAIVADEVRTLAQRTRESTAEIEQMIGKLQVGAKKAVGVMETGRSQAQDSVRCASLAGVSLKSITSAVNTIDEMNSKIAHSAREQSSISKEVKHNIDLLNKLSVTNSLAIIETTSSAENVALMASGLKKTITQFRV